MRRVFLIAGAVFAGLVVVSSRRGREEELPAYWRSIGGDGVEDSG
jgi:hypothetical protein